MSIIPPIIASKWRMCILAYYRGLTVQWRNNGGTEAKPSEWHDLTPEMVEGRGVFTMLNKISGPVWNWPWMEFRIKPAPEMVHTHYHPLPSYHGHAAQMV